MSLKSMVTNFKRLKIAASSERQGFNTAPKGKLFPPTDPDVDGDECLHDCASCTVRLPAKWSIDESDELYGMVKGWETHLVVATGKNDWVRDVADEKGSIMEAVEKGSDVPKPKHGRLMLSASNMPLPDNSSTQSGEVSTTVLLLPAFQLIDNVTPSNVHELITNYVDNAPTNTSPLPNSATSPLVEKLTKATSSSSNGHAISPSPSRPALQSRPCPHKYLILLCSQKTRDARCGQSAPLIRREFERHLRPLGLHRDLNDERPGGVGIYFISHVGGHKYAANVFVYRRAEEQDSEFSEAAQCIWLARVRPEDCENIVKYTVLQGKVVKPETQLRGGFDRRKQLVSW